MSSKNVKSVGIAYFLWFFFGLHYAYLGKWGIQILYWLTMGGFGIWALIDLFTMSNKVFNYNVAKGLITEDSIASKLEQLDQESKTSISDFEEKMKASVSEYNENQARKAEREQNKDITAEAVKARKNLE